MDWLYTEVIFGRERWYGILGELWLHFSRKYFWLAAVLLTGPLGFLAYGVARKLDDRI